MIMELDYAPEIRNNAEELARLEPASTLLAEVMGPNSSQLVRAKWNRVQDSRGRNVYRLTIYDLTGEVSTDFVANDLRNEMHMKFRMYRLWGDLLQIRNNRQHEEVQALSSELTTG